MCYRNKIANLISKLNFYKLIPYLGKSQDVFFLFFKTLNPADVLELKQSQVPIGIKQSLIQETLSENIPTHAGYYLLGFSFFSPPVRVRQQ